MAKKNFLRMMAMADEVFASRTDDTQLDVNEAVLEHLHRIHPSTVSGREDADGPYIWILLIPTTDELMEQFLADQISERELYERTPIDAPYTAVYLCSAMVLDEYRRKGLAKEVTLEALAAIRKDHSIRTLFAWPFNDEGSRYAKAVSREVGMPLRLKKK